MIQRVLNANKLIASEQLADYDGELASSPEIEGEEDPGWDLIASGIAETVLRLKSISGRNKTEVDFDVLTLLSDNVRLTLADAGDPRVWHYGSVLRYREFVWRRWTEADQSVSRERILGNVRRNAFSHLWWTAETLGERTISNRVLCEELFSRETARLRLWLIDFAPFYGRPELASGITHYCLKENITNGDNVDRFFRALGAIAAVSELDLYRSDPRSLAEYALDMQDKLSIGADHDPNT